VASQRFQRSGADHRAIDREAGAIRLTARADGLQPATITIRSEAASLRPFVP